MRLRKTSVDNNPDMRIKERKIKRKKIKRLKIRLFILIAIAMILFVLSRKLSLFNVSSIQVKGNYRELSDDLIKLSGINLQENIFSINKAGAIRSVESLPYVKSVRIKRQLPSTVVLEVEERSPFAQISDNAKYYLIGDDGVVLSEAVTPEYDIVTVKGISSGDFEVGKNIFENSEDDRLKTLLLELRDVKLLEQVENISFESGRTVNLYLDSAVTVVIEDLQDLNYRLRLLSEILNDVKIKGIKTKLIIMNRSEDPIVVTDE